MSKHVTRALLPYSLILVTFAAAACGSSTDAPATPQPPDPAKEVVFEASVDGNWDIYAVSIDGGSVFRLTTTTGDDILPQWSPDRSRIAWIRPNGTDKGIWVMRPDGSDAHALISTSGQNYCWTADGRHFVVGTAIIDTATKASVAIPDTSLVGDVACSPTAPQLAYTYSSGVRLMGYDGSNDHMIPGTMGVGPSFSPDGAKIVYTNHLMGNNDYTTNGPLAVVDLNGNGGPITQPPVAHIDMQAAWGRDGQRILFARSNLNAPYDVGVYVVNADGTNPHLLTSGMKIAAHPSW